MSTGLQMGEGRFEAEMDRWDRSVTWRIRDQEGVALVARKAHNYADAIEEAKAWCRKRGWRV